MESKKKGTNEPVAGQGEKMQTLRTNMWTQEGKRKVG